MKSGGAATRYHLIMMGVWAAALPPTLIWWRESILWVAFMSLYANFVGHYSAYEAARTGSSGTETEN